MEKQRKENQRPPRSPRFAWSDLHHHPDEMRGGRGGSVLPEPDLASLIHQIERRRRRYALPRREELAFLGKTTLSSLRMEGLQVAEADVVEALLKGGVQGDLRPRRAQLVRNHVAIQFQIERCIRNGVPLKPSAVLGWYASLCSGRPATGIDAGGMSCLEEVCRQVNSPPMQLQAAIADIAALHCRLLQDPLVPSFNGILARLLLRYHLGRCALPSVLFDEQTDQIRQPDQRRIYARLIVLLNDRLAAMERYPMHSGSLLPAPQRHHHPP